MKWNQRIALNSTVGLLGALLLLVSCADTDEISVDLDSVRERTERDFESAVLFRPLDDDERTDAINRAPLLMLEQGAAGAEPPTVAYRSDASSWTFYWWGGAMQQSQAIHATLDADGFPIAYEVFRDSTGAQLLFADLEAEMAAGDPLEGRRYALEPAFEEQPALLVGGLYEPGPQPLGPFVYLWQTTNDINVILCRCMPALVFDIVDSIGYRLEPAENVTLPAELAAWSPQPAGDLLRLAD